ncbi:glycosyltransferase family 4 protein [Shewanella glacialimarina]|uniref:glycosyltransferase family 4 protein n=1 Tax=Shewanella glacialimarina TaxID=2590884 RepID=UPI001CF81039|nr:glycosyltransferase [Shewanella glacialimarina]UCX04258.1 glycosyltransferase [Shewanella glacialimarina]
MYCFVIGPFPPPVHGMAKNLKIFAADLSKAAKVKVVDISPGTIVRGSRYHLVKLKKVFFGLCYLLKNCVFCQVKSIYLPPDAGFGAFYTLLFVVLAKVFSIPIFMHHRSFLYINRKTISMSLITKIQPVNSTHIFLCSLMKLKFEKLYGNMSGIIVSNAQYVQPISQPKKFQKKIVLGHLSNLGYEKGLKEVFELCHSLNRVDVDFQLELAGPAENDEVQKYISRQLQILGSKVNYYGSVNQQEKNKFYSKIDVFLFPTEYRNEAQPNVLFEAMAYGCPALTINTGCISTDIDCNSGFVFIDQNDFNLQTPNIVSQLVQKPEQLEKLKHSTLDAITKASSSAKNNYEQLINRVSRGY